MVRKKSNCLIVVFLCGIIINPLTALDTTEPFDIGFTDNEMYLAFDGPGLSKGDKVLVWEHVIGAGITDRIATTFFYSLESNEFLGNRAASGGVGLYFNILDLQAFDLDILTSINSDGSLTLATELNLDFSQSGIQLTLEEGMENSGPGEDKLLLATNIAPLLYFSLTESFQLLTAIDMTFIHYENEGKNFEFGSVGLGMNVGITSAIELISQLHLDIPQDGEELFLGLSVGFIATLPKWSK